QAKEGFGRAVQEAARGQARGLHQRSAWRQGIRVPRTGAEGHALPAQAVPIQRRRWRGRGDAGCSDRARTHRMKHRPRKGWTNGNAAVRSLRRTALTRKEIEMTMFTELYALATTATLSMVVS